LATGLGDDKALALAIEELDPKLRLQRFDLVAYSALRDEQFLGRPREALMAGRGLEGLESIEGRQPAQAIRLHEKSSGRLEKRCFAGNGFLVLLVCSVADAFSDIRSKSMSIQLAQGSGQVGQSHGGIALPERRSSPFSVCGKAIMAWIIRSSQRKALRELADDGRLLSDVGLTREQALREGGKPFWRR
jgi:uncharacterized protein YjiS (DUF1127 family)